MFYIDRERLGDTIERMQRQSCAYDSFMIDKESHPPSFCDCKYGYNISQIGRGGEQTGCPELRNVCQLLSKMTDDEYKEILSRNTFSPADIDELWENTKES